MLKPTRLVTCGYTYALDKPGTLNMLMRFRRITQAAARIACGIGVTGALLLTSSSYAYAPIKEQIKITTLTPKMYAKATLTIDQYKCALELYQRESNWRASAKNGSHYGIPQGKSIWLKNASPIEQVRWGINYVNARYGSMCQALTHFNRKGWH